MSPDLGRAYRELADRVHSDVVAPHPGEILVRARARQVSQRTRWLRRARRVAGFVGLSAAVPVALGLLLVLLPRPQGEVAPLADEPSAEAPEWADPPTRQDDTEPTAPPSGGAAIIPPGPVRAPVDPVDPVETVEVTLWFQNSEFERDGCRRWTEVTRDVVAADPLRGTVEAVLAGPTEEEIEDGLWSVYGVGGVPTTADLEFRENQQRVRIDFPDLYQVDYSESPECRSDDLRGPMGRSLSENFDDWRAAFVVEDSSDVFRAYVDGGLSIEDALERRR